MVIYKLHTLHTQVFDTSNFVDSLYTWSAFNCDGVGKIVGSAVAELSKMVDVDGIHLIGKYEKLNILIML